MKTKHSAAFRESIVQKITTPGGPSIMQMSEKLGINHTTIRYWIKLYANVPGMKKSKKWTPESKLDAVIKSAGMSENELGEYLRANGLHSSEIEQWKQDFYSAQRPAGRPKLDPELVELRNKEQALVSDLKRKDRALAEMSARVILLKKSHLIFGGTEEDE